MSDEDKSQKTEDPTPKRLADLKKKGNVPSSKEVGTMISVFALMMIATFVLPSMAPKLAGVLGTFLQNAPMAKIGTGTQGVNDAGNVIWSLMWPVILALSPMVLFLVLITLFGVMLQGETVVSLERIRPKASNISLLSGVKKIFSANNMVEFTKSMVKVGIVIAIGYFVVSGTMNEMLLVEAFMPEALPDFIRSKAALMFIMVSAFLIPVAIIDVVWKRLDFIRQNRMTMKEVRDEFKDSEGDPHLKAKLKQKRQEMSQKRISQAVPKATVILTNPTHFAVALKYEPGIDVAPVCVAKGVDAMAKKIREIAKDNEIPIIENRPLARALHAQVQEGDIIPDQHWMAVAEIVAFVMDLKNKVRRRPPEGSSLRED